MKKLIIATLFGLFGATSAMATNPISCERSQQQNVYHCNDGEGNMFNVSNAASAEAAATAVAAQLQGQVQGQNQTSENSNSNTNTNDNSNSVSNNVSFKDESVALSTPAGGGCTWGFNIGVPGTGGAGICGTTRNQAAGILAQIADNIGNPCLPENKLAVAALMRAPLMRGVKLECK
jgi:hypothetical protein